MRAIPLLLLAALTVTSCGPAGPMVKKLPPAVLDQGWTPVQSNQEHFGIGLPPGWVRVDPSPGAASTKALIKQNPQLGPAIAQIQYPEGTALMAVDAGSLDGGRVDSLIVVHKTGLELHRMDDSSVDQYRSGLMSSLPPGTQATTVAQTSIPIGDAIVSRLQRDIPGATGNTRLIHLVYFVPAGTETFDVRFETTEAREPNLVKLAKKVMDTFRATVP